MVSNLIFGIIFKYSCAKLSKQKLWKLCHFYIFVICSIQLLCIVNDIYGDNSYFNVILLINALILMPDFRVYKILKYSAFFYVIIVILIVLLNNSFFYTVRNLFLVTLSFIIGILYYIMNNKKSYELFLSSLELKEANERLVKLVVTDNLTKLHNRRSFEDNFNQMWLNCKRLQMPLSILMIDVDNFKEYNDLLGHPAGDKALVLIAETMQESLRRGTDFLARYGGEEFVALLPFVAGEEAEKVANSLLNNIENKKMPHPYNPASIYLTVSIGCSSVIPSDSFNKKSLLLTADEALYVAKSNGKNNVFFKEIDKKYIFNDKKDFI